MDVVVVILMVAILLCVFCAYCIGYKRGAHYEYLRWREYRKNGKTPPPLSL